MSNQTPLTALSLFSGAGGLDLGFHRTGKVQSVACYEYNEIFAQTLKYNLDKLTQRNSNIVPEIYAEDLSDDELMNDLIKKWSGTDIVFGGPPLPVFLNYGQNRRRKKVRYQ